MVKPVIKKISPADFFKDEKDKIKINWFCYEYALELQSLLDKKLKNKFKKKRISQETIINFCIQHSKFMKEQVLLQLAGKIPNIGINYIEIEKLLPCADDKLVDDILLVSAEAWDSQTEGCCSCPTRCISEKDAYAPMFDEKYYYE